MQHYNKLIPNFSFESLNNLPIIPDNWHEDVRNDVDINTRRNAVKTGLEKYIHW